MSAVAGSVASFGVAAGADHNTGSLPPRLLSAGQRARHIAKLVRVCVSVLARLSPSGGLVRICVKVGIRATLLLGTVICVCVCVCG